MHMLTLRTKEQVNEKIQEIFAKHNIKPDPGEEGFWNAVEDVEAINQADGALLVRLGNRWDRVPYA